jgi:hypothetical protein
LIDERTLGVACEGCEVEVARFDLNTPMTGLICADCGKPLGKGHKHWPGGQRN